ncbi:hypothetical protein Phou_095880 [Phytohabitans houttuyneae]|uniref:Uncharacterized protein n=1 Tax=Phytohabitans houttuyneae TaxID=1076126 RepID=A0A6V8KRZ2_9ACTN|nr:caspase family protein [Phytohabitans houttuyneae]GFJ85408.1 hypothetical protein Phou_095880 [Phytohabitans houttuyneae]
MAFRALLIGISEYSDSRIRPLPFVAGDVRRMAATLSARGYEIAHQDAGQRYSMSTVKADVRDFLHSAAPGDSLLILLSGHGLNHQGTDYLVPSDVDLRWSPWTDHCVSLDSWSEDIDRTRAGSVLFLVDACREGLVDSNVDVTSRIWWSQGRISVHSHPNAAFLFGCGPGQVSRFFSDESETYSAFARAVQLVLEEAPAPLTLAQFRRMVQHRCASLAAANGASTQDVSLKGRHVRDSFVVLPATDVQRMGEHRWVQLARSHRAWQHVEPSPARDILREDITALVAEYATDLAVWSEEVAQAVQVHAPDVVEEGVDPDDLWRSTLGWSWMEEQFVDRTVERTKLLLFLLGDLPLSAPEAALLVAMPFIHHLFHRLAMQAALVETGELPESPVNDIVPASSAAAASLRLYQERLGRLDRRMDVLHQAGQHAVEGHIRSWVRHRWLLRRGDIYDPASFAMAMTLSEPPVRRQPTAETLSLERVAAFLAYLRADPGFLALEDQARIPGGETVLAPGTDQEQPLRQRLVLYMLAVAQAMAIDIIRLPEVVVEHVGTNDGISLAELRQAVHEAVWDRLGSSRILRASCPHPALELGLRGHVDRVNELLAEVHRAANTEAAMAPLQALPVKVSADYVLPSPAKISYAQRSAGIRFRLADERIQELLMGKQLYGDPDLAIRELYQNALDACRYREARLTYLHRTHQPVPSWRGRIRFTQGEEDGRPYIDCEDNGVGMGIRELEAVFAEAGTRFSDLPEFLEEQAEWAALDDPVTLYPNSRFGIGVLSYFMLADEITLETCRMGRDGRPGERLRVSIAGPGTLFRIQPLGPGQEPGTRVRLHLRQGVAAPSCVQFLQRELVVAEFRTEATYGSERCEWDPDTLSPSAETTAERSGRYRGPVVPVPGGNLWWCNEGQLLSDGLALDHSFTGAVVNLRRDRAPILSVNRTKVISYDDALIGQDMLAAVPALINSQTLVLTRAWLAGFGRSRPLVADAILAAALEKGGFDWEIGGQRIDLALAGCHLGDGDLVQTMTTEDGIVRTFLDCGSSKEDVEDWRVTALLAAGLCPGMTKVDQSWLDVTVGRPSDLRLLEVASTGRDGYVPLGAVIQCAQDLGASVADVRARLQELGYRGAWPEPDPEVPDSFDLTIMATALGSVGRWLSYGEPVRVPHLLDAASWTRRSVAEVGQRLAELGYELDIDPAAVTVTSADPTDRIVVSRDLDGRSPWLSGREPVPALHIHRAAERLELPSEEVAARLRPLGYQVPDGLVSVDDDVWAALAELPVDEAHTYLTDELHPAQLLHLAQSTGRAVADLHAALVRHGYRPGFEAGDLTADSFDPVDVTISQEIVVDSAGQLRRWLDLTAPVKAAHIATTAADNALTNAQVAARLTTLGYTLSGYADVIGAGAPRHEDLVLASQHCDGRQPWIPTNEPVSVIHLLTAARRAGFRVADAADQLSRMGYPVPFAPDRITATAVEPDDEYLISAKVRDRTMLDPHIPLTLADMIHAAWGTHREIADVTGRLAELGYLVPTDLSPVGKGHPGPATARSCAPTSAPGPAGSTRGSWCRGCTCSRPPITWVLHRKRSTSA